MPRSRSRRPKPKGQPQPRPPRAWWTPLRQLYAVAAGALFLVSAAVVFIPRLTVVPASLEASNTAPTMFLMSNASVMPLWNVQPSIGICQISYGERPVPPDPDPRFCQPHQEISSFAVFTQWFRPRLFVNSPYTLAIQDAIRPGPPTPFSYADFSISVTYQPWFIPWRRTQAFRFFTKLEGDGKLYWFSE